MYKMNEKEIKAAKKVLEMVNIEVTEDNINHYISCDYLTINTGNDGKDYCWYLDADNNEACVCVDSLEETDAESVGLF